MTDESEFQMLQSLENWWDKTANPVYAWRAMDLSFSRQIPMPEWVLGYLKDAAAKMAALGCGRDFRQTEPKSIEHNQAKALVGEALGLWRGKSKNMFARVRDDEQAMKAALAVDLAIDRRTRARDVIFYMENGVGRVPPKPDEVRSRVLKNVQPDRASRILKRGRALNRAEEDRKN